MCFLGIIYRNVLDHNIKIIFVKMLRFICIGTNIFAILFVALIYLLVPKLVMYAKDNNSRYYVYQKDKEMKLCFDPFCKRIQAIYNPSKDPDYVLHYITQMTIGYIYPKNLQNILVFGLGGGSIVKYSYKYLHRIKLDVVEIDDNIYDIAKKYFNLIESDDIKVTISDACKFFQKTSKKYDLIIIDIYSNSFDSPLPKCVQESSFYNNVKNNLNKDGAIVLNVAYPSKLQTISSIVKQNFLHSDYYQSKYNTIIIAYNGIYKNIKMLKEKANFMQEKYQFPHNLKNLLNYKISPTNPILKSS